MVRLAESPVCVGPCPPTGPGQALAFLQRGSGTKEDAQCAASSALPEP